MLALCEEADLAELELRKGARVMIMSSLHGWAARELARLGAGPQVAQRMLRGHVHRGGRGTREAHASTSLDD